MVGARREQYGLCHLPTYCSFKLGHEDDYWGEQYEAAASSQRRLQAQCDLRGLSAADRHIVMGGNRSDHDVADDYVQWLRTNRRQEIEQSIREQRSANQQRADEQRDARVQLRDAQAFQ
ncbi:hypothetical protein TSOC_013241 [Tetrabaena socialis]|uniref:Uncharacterized protein n=1 Tax=Tetrabaena socialis TaxID=47790 RepID=A0A2J7ZKV6_9CHLO|nr:hypothetical protein TSOC_013240 [Tetrabaena socialis]PNH00906.1 hypothetical protein TSOC_013241 [Tetrabaena socialis]|eukprot:PNH00905.1 hypothetical protein TSOC_013240 [Tetrabaena socialis]